MINDDMKMCKRKLSLKCFQVTFIKVKIEPKMLVSDVYQGESWHFQLAGCESASEYIFCDLQYKLGRVGVLGDRLGQI